MFDSGAQNYYEILDVKPDAGQNEIRQAYLRIKAAYGKDSAALYSLFDDIESKRVLEQVEQAYLVLSSPEKRKEYDRTHGFMQTGSFNEMLRPGSSSSASRPTPPPAPSNVAAQAASPVPSAGPVFSFAQLSSSTTASAAPTPPPAPAALAAPTPPPAPAGAADGAESRPILRHEDYSTPRTLADAKDLAQSSVTSTPDFRYTYTDPIAESSSSRLGAIRRIELLRGYERNPAVEEEISRESEFRGTFFRRIREYKGISIEELSEFTKISKTYLSCIESEEYESLPAAVYLRGFILQIAKALKLPYDKAATGYMMHYKAAFLK